MAWNLDPRHLKQASVSDLGTKMKLFENGNIWVIFFLSKHKVQIGFFSYCWRSDFHKNSKSTMVDHFRLQYFEM